MLTLQLVQRHRLQLANPLSHRVGVDTVDISQSGCTTENATGHPEPLHLDDHEMMELRNRLCLTKRAFFTQVPWNTRQRFKAR